MSTTGEIARRYLVEEYLTNEPDFMSMIEWLDDHPDIVHEDFDGADDVDIHDEVIALLDVVAQRLADEEN